MDDVFHKLARPQMCSADMNCVKRVESNHVTEQNNEHGSVMQFVNVYVYLVGHKEIQTSVKSIDITLSITINKVVASPQQIVSCTNANSFHISDLKTQQYHWQPYQVAPA